MGSCPLRSFCAVSRLHPAAVTPPNNMKDLLTNLLFLVIIFGLMPFITLVVLKEIKQDQEAQEQFYKDMQQEKPEIHRVIDTIAPGRSQD